MLILIKKFRKIERYVLMIFQEGVTECNIETNVSEINCKERSIKIIKKSMYEEGRISSKMYFYGIAIFECGKEIYRPTYPYVRSDKDIDYLKDFIEKYENDLLMFYKNGHNYDFGLFVYGIGSGLKDRFRDDWYKKGVIFY